MGHKIDRLKTIIITEPMMKENQKLQQIQQVFNFAKILFFE